MKSLKIKLFLVSALSIFCALNAYSWDFVETFENHNAPATTYANGSYVGNNGITWNYVTGRGDAGFTINGKGLMLRDFPAYNARLFSNPVPNGIVNFRCLLKKAFTGAGARQVELYINGIAIAKSTSFDNTQVQVFEVNDINIEGNVVIELRNLGRQIVIDDLSWTTFGKDFGNEPTQIAITTISPAQPMKNVPFTAIVQFLDDDGNTNSFKEDKQLQLLLRDGNGTLSGVTNVLLPRGQTYYSFKGLTYNMAEQIRLRAHIVGNYSGDMNLMEIDRVFNVSETPILMADIYQRGHVGSVHPAIEVHALNSYGMPNQHYEGFNATLNVTGGSFTGTLTAQFKKGIAKFENIRFSNVANYNVSVSASHLGSSNNTNVNILAQPTMTEMIIPRYIKGEGTFLDQGGNGRIPHFALVRVNGLHPNTIYRFVSGWIIDIPNAEELVFTGGRNMHKQYFNDFYTYNSGKFLNNSLESSSLSADNTGTALVWMAVVSDNDLDVRTAGNRVNWLLALGSEKGSEVSRLYTTTKSAVLRYSTSQNDFNCDGNYGGDGPRKDDDELQVDIPTDPSCVLFASGIYDPKSPATPKNYIVLYDMDNVPVSATVVQPNGSTLQTPGFPHQAHWFYADYEHTPGAFATIVPNNLPGGIRKFVEYDAAGNAVNQWTDSDGIWAGYNTSSSNYSINPPKEGNQQSLVPFQLPAINNLRPTIYESICNDDENHRITFDARGTSTVNIWMQRGESDWEMLASNVDARKGYYDWFMRREYYTGSPIFLNVVSSEHNYNSTYSGPFRVYDTPIHLGNAESAIYCPNEDVQIYVTADGSDLKYQWYKDGVALKDGGNISGSNAEILTIKGVRHHNAGVYTAVVSGDYTCESVVSDRIAVYIARPIGFVEPAGNINIGEVLGQTTVFSFRAHVNGFEKGHPIYKQYDIKVQWYKYVDGQNDQIVRDDARISGAKSDYLTIRDLRRTDLGIYYAVVTGRCNNTAKSPLFTLMETEIKFVSEPAASLACIGSESVEFEAEATTAAGLNIDYQWLRNGIIISDGKHYLGAKTNKLTVLNPTKAQEGNYSLRATIQGVGTTIVSASASLQVNLLPEITMHPKSTTVTENGKIELEVTAIGNNDNETLLYQWYKDGVALSGANKSVYTIENAKTENAGVYYCTISNDCGDTRSSEAEIKIASGTTDITAQFHNGYILNAAVPNPVQGTSIIQFRMPKSNNVKLSLFNLAGHEVAVLFDGFKQEGSHEITINAKDSDLVSGTYYVTLRTNDVRLSNRLLIVK